MRHSEKVKIGIFVFSSLAIIRKQSHSRDLGHFGLARSAWYTKHMENTQTGKKIFLSPSEDHEDSSLSLVSERSRNKVIFIVDDDKFLLDMYTFKFKERGFEVIQAISGADALEKLKSGIIPDVMLLDVVMPTMDGFELLGIIKKKDLAPKAKVIILSNLGQPADIEKGRSLGASGYVIKASATPSEVVEKVMIVLGGSESFAEVN